MLVFYSVALATLSAATSWVLTPWAITRLRVRDIVDRPDARRVGHGVTPRGAGIVFVSIWSIAALLIWAEFWPLISGAVAVAAIGFADDLRELSVALRLVVHFVAATLVLLLIPGLGVFWFVVVVFLVTGHTNAFNFMDGSNGLAAMQAIFIAVAGSVLSGMGGHPELVLVFAILVGSVAGFLPHNFPHARCFMGDVGSTFLGFVLALLLVVAAFRGAVSFAAAAVLPAVFVTDASLTFAFRIATGQRWYTAHREHVYQRLIDSGLGAPAVLWMYAGVNLFVVFPTAVLVVDSNSPLAVAGLYAVLAVLWTVTQRRTRNG